MALLELRCMHQCLPSQDVGKDGWKVDSQWEQRLVGEREARQRLLRPVLMPVDFPLSRRSTAQYCRWTSDERLEVAVRVAASQVTWR